jgi:hypothetical protein
MGDITIRQYDLSDLEGCRALWVELTQRHREIYNDPTIGGDSPGLYFDKHLAQTGSKCLWVGSSRRGDRTCPVEPHGRGGQEAEGTLSQREARGSEPGGDLFLL